MTTIKDIFDFTESFAPVDSAADFDNCGLLVGDMSVPVTKVLLSLDITPSVVLEAKASEAELIISHHPVIFSPLRALSTESVPYLLAENGISALCLHTNLDKAEDTGVNVCLAKALGITDIVLYPDDFLAVGKLESEMYVCEFAKLAKETLSSECVLYTLGNNRVRTVAVSSGAGADSYKKAFSLGADLLLTGEAKHHEYLESSYLGIPLVTAGHFYTEDVVILPLREKLSARFPNLEFRKSSSCESITSRA